MNIIQLIQEGREEAFQDVYNQYKERLYFYFIDKIDSQHIAQELVQQSFIKLWVYRKKLNPDINIEIQLFRIARTTMIDLLRKRAKERIIMSAVPTSDIDNSLIDNIYEQETSKHVDLILTQKLSPVGQKVFRLSREEGLTYNEIAQELSISPKTVEYHISRALSILKNSILALIFFILR